MFTRFGHRCSSVFSLIELSVFSVFLNFPVLILWTPRGFTPDPKYSTPLTVMSSPIHLDKLHSILGDLQSCDRFIPTFSMQGNYLSVILSFNSFAWNPIRGKMLRNSYFHLQDGVILHYFVIQDRSALITNASPTGLDTILNKCRESVDCISRRLSKAEPRYSQTPYEFAAVHWAFRRSYTNIYHLHLLRLEVALAEHVDLTYFVHSKFSSPLAWTQNPVLVWCIKYTKLVFLTVDTRSICAFIRLPLVVPNQLLCSLIFSIGTAATTITGLNLNFALDWRLKCRLVIANW